jgi:hypothetical protein
MREACSLVWLALVGLFRSRASLEAEILILRHQLNIQRRQSPKRLNFNHAAAFEVSEHSQKAKWILFRLGC